MTTTFTNATCSIVLTALSAAPAFACGGGGFGGGFGGYGGGFGGGYSAPAIHQPIYRQPSPVAHQPQRVLQQPYVQQGFGQQGIGQPSYGRQPVYGGAPQYGQQPASPSYGGQPQPFGGQTPFGQQAPIGQQPQGQPSFAGQQPQQFGGQQRPVQGQQQQPQPFAQQPAQQPAAPQQQPTSPTAPQAGVDASQSALDALAAFGGAPATPPSAQPASFIGSWTATVNSANSVQLQLNADGAFSWVANSNGKVSSFGGNYKLADGQLTLIRTSDNQQLAGTLTPEASGGFRFKLASTSGDGLLFVQ